MQLFTWAFDSFWSPSRCRIVVLNQVPQLTLHKRDGEPDYVVIVTSQGTVVHNFQWDITRGAWVTSHCMCHKSSHLSRQHLSHETPRCSEETRCVRCFAICKGAAFVVLPITLCNCEGCFHSCPVCKKQMSSIVLWKSCPLCCHVLVWTKSFATTQKMIDKNTFWLDGILRGFGRSNMHDGMGEGRIEM